MEEQLRAWQGGTECSTSHPGRFMPWGRTPGTHCIGGWVDPGVSMNLGEEKFLALSEIQNANQSACTVTITGVLISP